VTVLQRVAAAPWRSRAAGLSLVELAVAVALASVVLAAGWSWFWSLHHASHRAAAGAELGTSLAYAQRMLSRDLRAATALGGGADSGCTQSAITLVVPADDGSAVPVLYSWDRQRAVVWRKAPGSYLADGVTAFSVRYFDAGGEELAPPAADGLPVEAVRAVRRVRFTLQMGVGEVSRGCEWDVALRAHP